MADGPEVAPPASRDLSPDAERSWRSLARHLERSERFTLVILAATDPAALDEIWRRVASRSGTARHLRLDFADRARWWVAELEDALEADDRLISARSPVWLALEGDPERATADRLRGAALGALNQYRTTMERSFRRPLLIALPKAYLPTIPAVAPDLWTIRGAVVEV